MQKWAFFAMGVMAGVIFILASALLGQYGMNSRAYAQDPSVTSEGGKNLLLAAGGSATRPAST